MWSTVSCLPHILQSGFPLHFLFFSSTQGFLFVHATIVSVSVTFWLFFLDNSLFIPFFASKWYSSSERGWGPDRARGRQHGAVRCCGDPLRTIRCPSLWGPTCTECGAGAGSLGQLSLPCSGNWIALIWCWPSILHHGLHGTLCIPISRWVHSEFRLLCSNNWISTVNRS